MHDFQEIRIGLNPGRLEAVHDNLSPAAHSPVIGPGKQRVYDPEEIGEKFFIFANSRHVGVIGHEGVGVEPDFVSIFKAEQQAVIEFLSPVSSEEPVFIVTLPGNMEGGAIVNVGISGKVCHGPDRSKNDAKISRMEIQWLRSVS
jgi:hypothetical protein